MLRRRRSFGSAIITPLIACSAANLSERVLVSGSHNCLRMRLLHRLRKDLQLLERGGGRLYRIAGRVHVGIAEGEHVLQPPSCLVALEVSDRLLVVPLGIGGRDRKEFSVVRERGLGPAFLDDRNGFLERLSVALLVLDRRAVRAAERFVLAR